MKHIAILKKNFKAQGGLEKQTLLIIGALLKKGHKISILTTKNEHSKNEHSKNEHLSNDIYQMNILKHPNISIYFTKQSFINILNTLKFNSFCKKWIKKNRVDISLAMDRTTNQTHIRAGEGVHRSYLKNRKNILRYLNPKHLLLLNLEKKAFENSLLKKIIVNSNMVKEQILKYFKIDPKIIKVIHNSVEFKKNKKDFDLSKKELLAKELLTKGLLKKQILKNLNLPQNKRFLLFASHDYKRKGLKIVLKALSLIKDLDIHLLVVGKDKNIKKYKKICEKLKIKDKITFFTNKKNLIPFYQISDILVLPTIYDPFANVVVEALSMGVYVITSKENGAGEILKDFSGYILKTKNPKELAYIIKKRAFLKPYPDAKKIRESIKHLDTSLQLNKLINEIL